MTTSTDIVKIRELKARIEELEAQVKRYGDALLEIKDTRTDFHGVLHATLIASAALAQTTVEGE